MTEKGITIKQTYKHTCTVKIARNMKKTHREDKVETVTVRVDQLYKVFPKETGLKTSRKDVVPPV